MQQIIETILILFILTDIKEILIGLLLSIENLGKTSSSPSYAFEGDNSSIPAFTPEEDEILCRTVGDVRYQRAILKAYILANLVRPIKAIPPGRCREWLKSRGGEEDSQGE